MSVTTTDIATELGLAAPTSTQTAQWTLWINDATRAIDRRAERLNIDPANLNATDVDYVVRQAVVDHARRPDSSKQITVSTDDSSVSRTYETSTGRVSILDEWWDLLGLAIKRSGYSVRVSSTWDLP